MEASIQEVARLTGTTSRTLRHYDAIGLLEPSRVGDNGYRWYDDRALVRLQRILLLRGLGLGLPDIRRVLEREQDETAALRHHLDWLRSEQRRLERQAEPEPAQQQDPLQPHQRAVVVPAVPVVADAAGLEQPDRVVVPQGAAGGARQPGHLLDRGLHASLLSFLIHGRS